jgi:hypothetical protein
MRPALGDYHIRVVGVGEMLTGSERMAFSLPFMYYYITIVSTVKSRVLKHSVNTSAELDSLRE